MPKSDDQSPKSFIRTSKHFFAIYIFPFSNLQHLLRADPGNFCVNTGIRLLRPNSFRRNPCLSSFDHVPHQWAILPFFLLFFKSIILSFQRSSFSFEISMSIELFILNSFESASNLNQSILEAFYKMWFDDYRIILMHIQPAKVIQFYFNPLPNVWPAFVWIRMFAKREKPQIKPQSKESKSFFQNQFCKNFWERNKFFTKREKVSYELKLERSIAHRTKVIENGDIAAHCIPIWGWQSF